MIQIKGMQVTKVDIKKECREMHGIDSAFELAIEVIKDKYDFTLNAEINKDATFTICLVLDRE